MIHFISCQDNGYTKEEMKVVWETTKIFGLTPADIKGALMPHRDRQPLDMAQ
jgi:aspartate-semialdehyde dehydrogenase